MPTIFQTNDRNGRPHRNWRIKYLDYNGKRKTITGLPSKTETEKLAWKIQAEQDEIRKGLRSPPKESEKKHFLADIIAEYLAWGESQGGHGGRPWSDGHRKSRRWNLKFWRERLGVEFLHDLNGSLPRVEESLREIQAAGRSGKTLQNIAEALAAFCDWAVKRGYLEFDPLKNLQKFNVSPRTVRRAMTIDEVLKLLRLAPPDRRILYEVALASGLRANELRSLVVRDFDAVRGGFNLKSVWTKNRKSIFQPLPQSLVEKLVAATATLTPSDRILAVPKSICKAFYRDLTAAGIARLTDEGKLDFHALRTTFATFVFEVGASVKEAHTLARHSTPDLTVNVYARTRSDRLADIADKIGALVMGGGGCPTVVQQPKAAENGNTASHSNGSSCSNGIMARNAGSNPDRRQIPISPQAGPLEPNVGRNLLQVGQEHGVELVASNASRTPADLPTPICGQEKCPTVVQQHLAILSGRSAISRSVLAALEHGFEISYETKATSIDGVARRWYANRLLNRSAA